MNWESTSTLVFIILTTIFTGGKNDSVVEPLLKAIPLNYNIRLTPYIEIDKSNMTRTTAKPLRIYNHGESGIIINLVKPALLLSLHKENIVLNSVTLITRNGRILELQEYTYDRVKHLLQLDFDITLFPGLYTLKMEYGGYSTSDNRSGFFTSSHVNEDGHTMLVVATNIQTTGATRKMFPCWDEPQLKATYTISVKHHRNFTALSNTLIRRRDTDGDVTWSHFYTSPPLSTYHLAIVVTNYYKTTIFFKHRTQNLNIDPRRTYDDHDIWYRNCFDKNYLSFATRKIVNMTLYLGRQFRGITISKIHHIAVPAIPQESVSKWGIIFHREEDLMYDAKSDTFVHQIEIVRRLGIKIAHQWFIDIVSPQWWSTLWLYNGLGVLYGEEAAAQTFDDPRIMDFFIIQNQYDALLLDNSNFDMNPPQIYSPSNIPAHYSTTRYIKVLIILRMLQDAITNTVFQNGVRTYLYQNSHRSLDSSEFWSTLEREGKSSYPCKIASDFSAWLVHRNYPRIILRKTTSDWNNRNRDLDHISLRDNKWCIPMRVVQYNYTSLNESILLWLTPKQMSADTSKTPNQNWVMIDIRRAAYYRVEYDSNWYMLARYMNSSKYKEISVINRAKLIDDSFYLSIVRSLNISTFWNITYYLSQSTEYNEWYTTLKIFEYISSVIPYTFVSIGIHTKEKIKALLDKPLQILGFEDHKTDDGFIKSLRQEILKWACVVDHSKCLEMAIEKLRQYYQNPLKNTILPGWEKWTYCNGLKRINRHEWNVMKDTLLRQSNLALLPYLACRNSSTVIKVFPSILQNLSRSQDIRAKRMAINTFHGIIEKHSHYFFYGNLSIFFETRRPEAINTRVAFTTMINYLYSEQLISNIVFHMKKKEGEFGEQLLLKFKQKTDNRVREIREQLKYYESILS